MAVSIVTDSVSDIGSDIGRRMGIAVVPQNVHLESRRVEDDVTGAVSL